MGPRRSALPTGALHRHRHGDVRGRDPGGALRGRVRARPARAARHDEVTVFAATATATATLAPAILDIGCGDAAFDGAHYFCVRDGVVVVHAATATIAGKTEEAVPRTYGIALAGDLLATAAYGCDGSLFDTCHDGKTWSGGLRLHRVSPGGALALLSQATRQPAEVPALDGDLALVTGFGGFEAYDVTRPESPVLAGCGRFDGWAGATPLANGEVVVVATAELGAIAVFDRAAVRSSTCAAPAHVLHLPLALRSPAVAALRGQTLYAGTQDGLAVVHVEPAFAAVVATLEIGTVTSLALDGDRLHAIVAGRLIVLDATAPDAPRPIADLDPGDHHFTRVRAAAGKVALERSR